MQVRFLLITLSLCLSSIQGHSLYVGGWAGSCWVKDRVEDDWVTSYQVGPAVAATLGLRLPYDLRAEIEVLYRENSIKKQTYLSTPTDCTGHLQKMIAFGNIIYDLPICWILTPYIGLGLGWEKERFDRCTPTSKKKTIESRVACQFITGLFYTFSCRTTLHLQYQQYLADPDHHTGALSIGCLYWF